MRLEVRIAADSESKVMTSVGVSDGDVRAMPMPGGLAPDARTQTSSGTSAAADLLSVRTIPTSRPGRPNLSK